MNEIYSEVREHLRQQHAMNTQEICGKKLDNFNNYRYYGNGDAIGKREGSTISILNLKICFFLVCVMLFSFYIYGGQDVKKGAAMAYEEMKVQITKLEQEEPAVKQAMSYVRKAYHEVEDFTETYMDTGD